MSNKGGAILVGVGGATAILAGAAALDKETLPALPVDSTNAHSSALPGFTREREIRKIMRLEDSLVQANPVMNASGLASPSADSLRIVSNWGLSERVISTEMSQRLLTLPDGEERTLAYHAMVKLMHSSELLSLLKNSKTYENLRGFAERSTNNPQASFEELRAAIPLMAVFSADIILDYQPNDPLYGRTDCSALGYSQKLALVSPGGFCLPDLSPDITNKFKNLPLELQVEVSVGSATEITLKNILFEQTPGAEAQKREIFEKHLNQAVSSREA